MTINTSTSTKLGDATREKALSLLACNVPDVQVANALGVSVSRITQLLSEDEFKDRLAELKYTTLSKHVESDKEKDQFEDKLLGKLQDSLEHEYRAPVLLKAFQVLNAAKRRSAPGVAGGITSTAPTVQLIMPTKVVNKFTTNIYNQVIKTGQQELITVQSNQMGKMLDQTIVQNRVGRLLDECSDRGSVPSDSADDK